MAQLIPKIQPNQLKNEPDQVSAVLNQLIDTVNRLNNEK